MEPPSGSRKSYMYLNENIKSNLSVPGKGTFCGWAFSRFCLYNCGSSMASGVGMVGYSLTLFGLQGEPSGHPNDAASSFLVNDHERGGDSFIFMFIFLFIEKQIKLPPPVQILNKFRKNQFIFSCCV